jgi:hypothetical protein
MRSASLAFANTVAGSHQVVSRCDVLFDREVIAEGVNLVDGRIDYDRTAAHLARLDALFAEPTRVPVAADDILTPYGYELLVWRGVRLGAASTTDPFLTDGGGEVLTDEYGNPLTVGSVVVEGSVEMVPLGVFPIQTSDVDGITLSSAIVAEDRSRLVSDARFEDVYQIAAGTNYATAIEELIDDGVSGLEFLFPSVTFTTPLLTFAAQDDRWEAAQTMAKSIGHELLFDGLGRVVLRPEPTFTADPDATVAEGVNMVSVNVKLDRVTAYNKVIATSVNAANGAQYRGEAADLDPASPTYYDGPFGRKPRFFASEFLASDEQCETAAASILASNLGVARSVDFSAVPDPRLECSDVVRVVRSALALDELHIIDSLSIGLGADGGMSARSRASQVPS